MRREIQISGSFITTMEEFHQEISMMLSFPSYYGNNLDDLLDCLLSYIDPNISIYWLNSKISQKNLENQFDQIIEVFDRVKNEYSSFEYYLN
ncbi:barstar family protein [Bacteriovorax sp. Seq25_V]|uniref:barstar family protein n=1 Tax=Bacteriovorax sp. Seq25_V TaxID=1201288 RepID=UPI00038A55F7|nr:barstar family protein [Bacteriovorax sp. Seq25_V]EQC44310.1 barstar [Bacteriovorax sp. Seq25_V]